MLGSLLPIKEIWEKYLTIFEVALSSIIHWAKLMATPFIDWLKNYEKIEIW